jgi:O-antigen/teichoic acid export membrane protein
MADKDRPAGSHLKGSAQPLSFAARNNKPLAPSSTVHTILKNIFSLSVAQVLTKLLTLFVVAYTARTLGVEQYGRWSFALTVASYVGVLANLGLDSIAARHLARDRSRLGSLVSQVLHLKFAASALGLVVVGLVAWALPKSPEVKWLTFLCYLPLALGFWNLAWVFIGLERLEFMALAQLVEQVAHAAFIFLLVRGPSDVMRVPVTAMLGAIVGGLCIGAVFWVKHGPVRTRLDRAACLALLRETLPFGITQVLGQMYYNFDTVMLGFMRTDTEVGWYNAAYKLLSVVITFRYTIIYSLNPTFARLFAQSSEEMQRLARHVLRLSLYAALPLGVGGTMLAQPIVRLIFGEAYAPAASALRVLVWSPAFLILNIIGPVLLSAAGRWYTMLKIVAAIVALNVGLNLFLIPKWGIVGAAWATLAADILSLVLHAALTRKMVPLAIGRILAKPCLCALLMGVVLLGFRTTSVLLSIPLGAAIYAVCMVATGAVKWSELRMLVAFKSRS